MKLAIVIPALNEEATIGTVIRTLPQNIPGVRETLVIVVDDGSEDETSHIAHVAGAHKIVRHNRNAGVGAAIKRGILEANKLSADIVCLLDADGQFDNKEIEKLVYPIITDQADLVIGTRFHKGLHTNNVPIVRKIFNKLVAIVVSVITSRGISDAECGFRAMNSKAARNLKLLGRFTFTHDMLIDLASKHFRIMEIPISVRYFDGRESRAIRNLVIYGIGVMGMLLTKTILSFRNGTKL